MSNKTQLQTNNATLDNYIARINAAKDMAASLPEAGSDSGGGSAGIEVVDVTFINNNMFDDYYTCGTWLDNGNVVSYPTDIYSDDSKTKTVIKNSYITLDYSNVASISGSYVNLGAIGTATAIQITGDCTITFE